MNSNLQKSADCHGHLADLRIYQNAEGILRQARAAGMIYFLQAGVDPADWQRQLSLHDQHPEVLCCFGLHPMRLRDLDEQKMEAILDQLARSAADTRVVAIGETGIDLREVYRDSFELQMRAFELQVELAVFAQKPLVLHVVKAHDLALRALKIWKLPTRPGLVHAFSGDWEVARQYLDLGFHLSLGSMAARKMPRFLQTLKKIPLDRLLLESDCPDQPLAINTQSSPVDVLQIAQTFATALNLEVNELLDKVLRNLEKLLHVKSTN